MNDHFDRREFAKRAVLSSLAVGASTVASAQQDDQPETNEPEEKPQAKPEDLLLDVIRQEYPSENLTTEVLQQIRQDISGHRSRSRVLKEVPLTNGEAPFVFRAYRAADGEAGAIQIRPRQVPAGTKSP